jgi:hypothetical protein
MRGWRVHPNLVLQNKMAYKPSRKFTENPANLNYTRPELEMKGMDPSGPSAKEVQY